MNRETLLRQVAAETDEPLGIVEQIVDAALRTIAEADDVAPQQPLPENRRMLGDVDRIVRRGRVRGFRVLMISQRPAVLNKNVLSMASVLIAMRMPGPQDRKAIDAWIKGQAAGDEAANVMATLPGLQRGEGWVWAPEQGVLERTKFPMIRTFDSMRTPEIDEEVVEPTGLAPVELGDLRALLQAEDETAGQPQNGRSSTDPQAMQEAEQRGYDHGLRDGRLEGMSEIAEATSAWRREIAAAGRALAEKAEAGIGLYLPPPDAQMSAEPAGRELPVGKAPSRAISAPPAGNGAVAAPVRLSPAEGGGLPTGAAKLLAVLARGMRLTWGQTATLAGLKARGGSFNTSRKALRDGGYITEDGDLIAATERGFEAAGGRIETPSTPEELLSWWRSALPTTPGRVLDQLHRQSPKWVRKDRLAEFLGVAARGGSWNTALSILRQNQLIEVKGDQLRSAL